VSGYSIWPFKFSLNAYIVWYLAERRALFRLFPPSKGLTLQFLRRSVLQVEESVQQFLRNQYACSGHWKLSEVAKHLSDTRLFAVVLRESSPRQFCLRESFRHLHHTSLHVYETSVVCEQGAVRPTLRSCVVELGLKDHFAVSAPTPNFQVVLESLPSVYVGSAERFASLVVYISQQLAISFKVKGMPLPPWRTAASLLSKWFPEQPVDTTVAAMAGHAHGFDEHKAIPIRHFGLPKACPSVEHSSGPNLELQGLPAAEACCKLHTGTNKSLAEQDGTPRSDMRPIPSAAAPGLIKAHMAADMGTEDAFLHAFG